MTTVDFALSQRRDVDLHPAPSFRAVLHGRVSERRVSRLVGPSGQPDANDDHVKGDGDDGRDLFISDNVSVGCSSLGSKARWAHHVENHVLAVGLTEKANQRHNEREGVNRASIDKDL